MRIISVELDTEGFSVFSTRSRNVASILTSVAASSMAIGMIQLISLLEYDEGRIVNRKPEVSIFEEGDI
ncbi:hypothetical protein L1987_38474 [Smallanthus sonchifolius]|uniref:Uncharacterized protein n=1 Tax=Smallanthus sonchifolius TaxID=185202 RepID=A0ACB9HJB5_9ASTR|nr:hypothetical protein L1987_38474 [Smallanthus sonchifolius]